MRNPLPLLLAALLATTLTACGGASDTFGGTSAGLPAASAPETAPSAGEAPASDTAGGAAPLEGSNGAERDDSAADPAAQAPSQRLVIKNANVSLQVERVSDAEASIRARADQLGGYVVSVSTSGSGEYLSTLIVFRVPTERFEDALSGVEGLAKEVLSRTVSGEDVTEEFVDLGSRLRNLEATRDRLLDLLAKATRVEDALQVNQALTDVQGEIEQIQGRRQYLQQSAAFSTISAELRPVPLPPSIIEEDSWQPLLVATEALAGLVAFGQGVLNLAIVFAVWSPLWLPLLLLARWAWRRRPVGRAARPSPPAPPTPTT